MKNPNHQKQLRELLKREVKKASKPKFVLQEHLFDKQWDFVSSTNNRRAASCSRRAGKTVACAADLYHTATTVPNVNCLYITLSRTSAKRIIWRELLQLCKKYGGLKKQDNVELSLEFENGSMIYLSGAKDTAEIEKFRGMALYLVYIDEAQSFRTYLRDLIDEVLEPALLDHDGTLAVIGTPNASCAGVFHDAFHRRDGYREWDSFSWTIHNNPHIERKSGKTADELLRRILKKKGWSADNPAFQREYLGRWVYDADSLVFKFNEKKNLYTHLPEGDWSYILGVDVGFNDADAAAVLAFSDSHPEVYLVEEIIKPHQDITALVNMVSPLIARYKPVKQVMDAGALGKKIQEEISRRHGIMMEAAEKHRKYEFIELMNDDLRTGRFKVRPGMQWIEDSRLLQWDIDINNPERVKISNSFHSDITDAVLYAWRESLHFTYRKPKPVYTRDSAEWLEEWEQQEIDRLGRDAEIEWWERGFDGEL